MDDQYVTIIMDPNPILRIKAEEVVLPLSKSDRTTLEKMLKYIKDSKDEALAEAHDLKPGIGLAAPQIGISKRLIVLDLTEGSDEEKITYQFALVNPKIISHSEKESYLESGEGCLSVEKEYPGYAYRAAFVTVTGYDLLTDKNIRIRAGGLLAIALQHEIDHLNGILYYDRINKNDPFLIKPQSIKI